MAFFGHKRLNRRNLALVVDVDLEALELFEPLKSLPAMCLRYRLQPASKRIYLINLWSPGPPYSLRLIVPLKFITHMFDFWRATRLEYQGAVSAIEASTYLTMVNLLTTPAEMSKALSRPCLKTLPCRNVSE
jgi:hypothetical protein